MRHQQHTVPNDRELLRLHVEAVWGVSLPPLTLSATDVELTPESALPEWSAYIGVLRNGERICIWRPDVAPANRAALARRADEALALPTSVNAAPGISREVALHQIAAPKLSLAEARQIALPLSSEHLPLLALFDETAEAEASEYYLAPARAPLFGVIEQRRLLSLAHSSRRTGAACELGINTRPNARQRGYALAATLLWAEAVARAGLIPFYSALAENTASLALAAAAGYRPFLRGATLTQKQTLEEAKDGLAGHD